MTLDGPDDACAGQSRVGWGKLSGPAAEAIEQKVAEMNDPDRGVLFRGNLMDPAFVCHWPGIEGYSPINFVGITERRLEYLLMVMHPGQEFPRHIHDICDEVYTVVQGKGQIFIEKQWYEAGMWDVFHIVNGTWHTLRNPAENAEDFLVWVVTGPPVNYKIRHAGWGITRKRWEESGFKP